MPAIARRYVYVQFLLFIGYVVVPRGYEWAAPAWLSLAGAFLCPYGLILIGWAIWLLRRQLSPYPVPTANARLLTSGPFRYLRHPIYTGILLLLLGYALWSAHPGRLGVTILLAILFWFKAAYEEAQLLRVFPEYAAYCRQAGRLWPRWKAYR